MRFVVLTGAASTPLLIIPSIFYSLPINRMLKSISMWRIAPMGRIAKCHFGCLPGYGAMCWLADLECLRVETMVLATPWINPFSILLDYYWWLQWGWMPLHLTNTTGVDFPPFPDTMVSLHCSFMDFMHLFKWPGHMPKDDCDSTEILSTSNCFAPPAYGCYCLTVKNEFSCKAGNLLQFPWGHINHWRRSTSNFPQSNSRFNSN